jgi:hypothetical protein
MFGQSVSKIVIWCYCLGVLGCTSEREYSPIPHDRNDHTTQSDIGHPPITVIPDPPEVFVVQDIQLSDPFEGMSEQYRKDCLRSVWLRCPPFDEYWIAEAVIDICDDHKIVLVENCRMQHECDASDPIIVESQHCLTDDGSDGRQTVYCDKGKVQLTPCEPCTDDVCDTLDNDCDDFTDEGPYDCENTCGVGPAYCVVGVLICEAPDPGEEICDYLDNDCDDLIDEGQRNACDKCGLLPPEECDNVDNDCNGDTDEDLLRPCSTPCGAGFETCVSGTWVACTAKQPAPEVCDGLDNDCDEEIDEELECICTIQDVGAFFPCQEPPLLCGMGYKTCKCLDPGCITIATTPCYAMCYYLPDPMLTCDEFVGMPLSTEDCNNFDDDCDQAIDEDLYAVCYTGPVDTLGIGACIPGEFTCDAGIWGHFDGGLFIEGYCKDEVIPSEEICNGLDDDCDGDTDWGYEIDDHDILFIVDWSGSMTDEIAAVMIALNQFAKKFSDEKVLQWAIAIGPLDTPGTSYKDQLRLHQNLIGFSNFMAAMSSLDMSNATGAYEMLLDAIYLSLQNIADPGSMTNPVSTLQWYGAVGESYPPKDQFYVNWRPNVKRIVIVFSDEPQQSFFMPKLTASDIIKQAQSTPELKIYVFSTSDTWEWDEIAISTGGKYFDLTASAASMYIDLIEILDDICKSGSTQGDP